MRTFLRTVPRHPDMSEKGTRYTPSSGLHGDCESRYPECEPTRGDVSRHPDLSRRVCRHLDFSEVGVYRVIWTSSEFFSDYGEPGNLDLFIPVIRICLWRKDSTFHWMKCFVIRTQDGGLYTMPIYNIHSLIYILLYILYQYELYSVQRVQ